jgi:small-conductance mechanosensitive channel
MDSAAQQTILAEAWDSPRRIWNDWQDFLEKYLARIPWHLGLFLALITFFHFLRRSSLSGAAQGGADEFKVAVIEHPISSSLLLSLIPSAFFYPGAPAGVLRAVMAPMMLSIVILLPRLLSQKYRSSVRLLTALYLLEFLRSLLPEHWLLNRLLLLVIAIVGCIAITVFLRGEAAEQERAGLGQEIVLLSLRVGLVLFVVSILCNLIGNMILAEMLPATLVRITYAGGVIYASAHLTLVLALSVLRSRAVAWLRSVRTHADLIGYRCRTLIRLVAAASWVVFSLYIVGLLDQVRTAAAKLLEVRWQVGAAEISIQDIAVFVAVFLTALILSRLLRFLLADEILPRLRLPRGAPGAVDVLARYGVLLVGFIMALAAAGVDLSKVTLLISALGVGIGFGLQNVVNNFVSGLILVFEHPLQVGDAVEVGTTFGEVRRIGFRASVLRTPDGADVVIPNGELVGGRFVNWSLFDRMRRISISVGVAYGTDAKRVIDILEQAARTHPAVFAHPAPTAVFDRFGESALNFTLLCWSSVDEFFSIRSELTVAIQKAFTELGIQVPFPQQDVHLHWSKGAREKVLG